MKNNAKIVGADAHIRPAPKEYQNNSGITLVALVVTIIVLLILAGISLSLVAGSNGILNKAEKAVSEHRKGEDKEILELVYAELYIENKIDGKEINADTLKQELINKGKDVSVEEKQGDSNKLIVINKENGNAYEIDKETGKTSYIGSYTGKYDDIEIKEGDIVFETNSTKEWFIEDATVSIKVNEEIDMTNFELQVSKDGKNWEPYLGQITLTETTTIYTKIVDKVTGQVKTTASIEVKIDKEKPVIESVSSTTSKITFTATDSESGIVGYAVTTTNTEPTIWTECENTKTLEKIETGKTQETTYYIWVKDGAGNMSGPKPITTGKLPTVSASDLNYTTTWNGTNVTVNFTTTSGFDMEISTDGVNWEKTTSKTVATGTQIYVRYTDGTNAGEKMTAVKPLWRGTVTYNANGGTGSVPSAQSVQHTTTATVSFSPVPTKTGYTFQGWATSSSATTATYTSTGTRTFTMGTSNVTLYAVWKINTYGVTYNANGGSGVPSAQVQNYNTTVTVSFSTTPTRVGYTFQGWATSNSATSATYTSSGTKTFTLTGNVTLYAVWKQIDPLYLYNNGTIHSTVGDFVVAYGSNDVSYDVGRGSFTKQTNYLDLRRAITSTSYASGQWLPTGFLSKNKVDVTNYRTLTFTYKTTSYMTSTNSTTYQGASSLDMGLSSYSSSNSSDVYNFINGKKASESTDKAANSTKYLNASYDIDISSVTGQWYIGAETLGRMWTGQCWYIYCTSIYLH